MSDSVQSGVVAHCESEVAVSCEVVAFVLVLFVVFASLLFQSSKMAVTTHAFQHDLRFVNHRTKGAKEMTCVQRRKKQSEAGLEPAIFSSGGKCLIIRPHGLLAKLEHPSYE